MSKQTKKVRIITGTAMLTAIGVILQYLEIAIPIIPSFIKLDFSDLPGLIGSFAYGPVVGIIITLLRNLIHGFASNSLFIGELSNFILSSIFCGVAGLIYKKKKTKKGAIIGGIVGAFCTALISIATNYFLIYPLYYNVMGFPEEAILGMYQAILPKVQNILQALIIFNVPFTFVKLLFSVIISRFIYKPLSPILKGKQV